jgi:hypothetical protein
VLETEEKKSQSDTGEEQQKGGKKLLGWQRLRELAFFLVWLADSS